MKVYERAIAQETKLLSNLTVLKSEVVGLLILGD